MERTLYSAGLHLFCSSRCYNSAKTFPPIQELAVGKCTVIPEGGISQVDHVGIAAEHDQDMAASVSIGGKADNDRLALVGEIENLIKCPGITPDSLKAKL